MAISQGVTTARELRLHVKLTYSPANTSDIFRQAIGELPREDGSYLSGGASTQSTEAYNRGRKAAEADLGYLARLVARWAQMNYSNRGFDIPVEAMRVGMGWRLAVTGDDKAQKWARILEVGYGPQDMHNFIANARKKKAIKIRNKGDQPGYYMIIPKVHGKVSRGENGKLTFTHARDERLGQLVNKRIEALEQFQTEDQARAGIERTFWTHNERGERALKNAYTLEDYYKNRIRLSNLKLASGQQMYGQEWRDRNANSVYPYGKPNGEGEMSSDYRVGYDPAGETVSHSRVSDQKVLHQRGAPVITTEANPEWQVIKLRQTVRAAGAIVEYEKKDGGRSQLYDRTYRDEHDLDRYGKRNQRLSNREGARLVASLNQRKVKDNPWQPGSKIVNAGVNNLRFVSLDADLPNEPASSPAKQTIASRRGDVLSFITISTRKPLQRRPGRAGEYIMRDAAQLLDRRIRELIAEVEKRDSGKFRHSGYIETLRSALGRSL